MAMSAQPDKPTAVYIAYSALSEGGLAQRATANANNY